MSENIAGFQNFLGKIKKSESAETANFNVKPSKSSEDEAMKSFNGSISYINNASSAYISNSSFQLNNQQMLAKGALTNAELQALARAVLDNKSAYEMSNLSSMFSQTNEMKNANNPWEWYNAFIDGDVGAAWTKAAATYGSLKAPTTKNYTITRENTYKTKVKDENGKVVKDENGKKVYDVKTETTTRNASYISRDYDLSVSAKPASNSAMLRAQSFASSLDKLFDTNMASNNGRYEKSLAESTVVSYETYLPKLATLANPYDTEQSWKDFFGQIFSMDTLKEIGATFVDAGGEVLAALAKSLIPSVTGGRSLLNGATDTSKLGVKQLSSILESSVKEKFDFKTVHTQKDNNNVRDRKGFISDSNLKDDRKAVLGETEIKRGSGDDETLIATVPLKVDEMFTKRQNWNKSTLEALDANLNTEMTVAANNGQNYENDHDTRPNLDTLTEKAKKSLRPREDAPDVTQVSTRLKSFDRETAADEIANASRNLELSILHLLGFPKNPEDLVDMSTIFTDFVSKNPLLAQHQYTLTINRPTTVYELPITEELYNTLEFRVKGITIPEAKRDTVNLNYGHAMTTVISKHQATMEHKADLTIICDRNFDIFEYLTRLAGLSVCENELDADGRPKNDDYKIYNLSTVADSNYATDHPSTAVIRVLNGRSLAKEGNGENREYQFDKKDFSSDVFKFSRSSPKGAIQYAKLPVFVLSNFKVINLSPSFKFDSSSVGAKLLEIKATVSWTRMKVYWEADTDPFFSEIG